MEAKKRFKFYTTTVKKTQCLLKYNYCKALQVSNTVKQRVCMPNFWKEN